MRDWNQDSRRTNKSDSRFWSYLWGIEIRFLIVFNFPPFYVLILPMRDWNRCPSIILLNQASMFWSYLWGIEIISRVAFSDRFVYVLILPMRDWNLFKAEKNAREGRVLILPMRDWNPGNGSSPSPVWSFWSYLWGIEISTPRQTLDWHKAVLILPMRDWNFKPSCLYSLSLLRFDLTYEGLKWHFI